MDPLLLFDLNFWDKIWNAVDWEVGESEETEKKLAAWSRRAQEYFDNVASPSGQRRIQDTLDFLDVYNVLQPNLRILDLGCGPGNFTLAFAERGHEVVALDPVPKMIGILEEKLNERPNLKPLVTTVIADWVTVSLEDYGWQNHFDLVFVSMTPGVRNPATLTKAMAASRQNLFLSLFAGPRHLEATDTIYKKVHGAPYNNPSRDALLPLNWLYTHGYRPVVHYTHWDREHQQTIEQAVSDIKKHLAVRMQLTTQVEQLIENHVRVNASPDGIFTDRKGSTAAMLLWDIDKKCLALKK
ncbi:MAG: methyltransferase domain-containing protein [Firmicutes bacterium]|nr:methyltransferase domain-containing protein [Bacillota bacterium]